MDPVGWCTRAEQDTHSDTYSVATRCHSHGNLDAYAEFDVDAVGRGGGEYQNSHGDTEHHPDGYDHTDSSTNVYATTKQWRLKHKEIIMSENTIRITVHRGRVETVENLPDGWYYEVVDLDEPEQYVDDVPTFLRRIAERQDVATQ